MAIADTITSMQNHTSNAYTILNYATDLTGKNKNLANLKQCIFDSLINSMSDTLNTTWDSLPKITTTPSTSQSINNTIEAPMRIELGASELSQSGTPTPSSPQDIHTISGDNTISVCGKNLFDNSKAFLFGANNIYVASSSTYNTNGTIKIQPSTTYILTLTSGTISDSRVYFYDKDMTAISNVSGSSAFTTPSNAMYLGFYATSGNQFSGTEYAMLELGNARTTYEPYNGDSYSVNLGTIEYSKISTYEDKFIRNSGKNLFEGTLVNKTFMTTDGTMVSSGTRVAIENYITLSNGTYTINSNKEVVVYVYDTSNNFVSGESFISWNNVPFTFNITGTKKIRVGFRNTDNSNISPSDVTNIMLNKGTALPYEPYGTNQWYIKKNIGKLILDGSENWNIYNNIFYLENIPVMLVSGITTMSNYFTAKNNAGNTTEAYNNGNYTICGSKATYNRIYLRDDDITTTTNLQIWLSTHNTNVYYALATPTYTQITGTLAEQLEAIYNAMSKDGQTNISQVNNDLGFVFDTKVLQDLS